MRRDVQKEEPRNDDDVDDLIYDEDWLISQR